MNAQQLRNSILQQAIQGKLVPQDPRDEPASVLLDRIRKEKEQLVKEGKLKKKDLVTTPVTEDEMPFEIPESWEWVRYIDIANCELGKTKNPSQTEGDISDYLCSINVYWDKISLSSVKQMLFTDKEKEKYQIKKGDMLICEGGETGRTAIWSGDTEMYYQNALHRVRFYGDIISKFYLYQMMIYKDSGLLDEHIKGETIQHFVLGKLQNLPIPLPPLSEQRRIVAKLEELLPLVEQYGKAQDQLDALNADLPRRLRQSILQQAIQGKLVPQDEKDGTAEDLITSYGVLPSEPDEDAFCIPASWRYIRFGDIVELVSGTSYGKGDVQKQGLRVLRGGNIQNDKLVLCDDDVFLPMSYKSEKKNVQKGDIIIVASTGSKKVIGKPALIEQDYPDMQIGAFLRIIRLKYAELLPYIWLIFCSPLYRDRISALAKGTNINNIKEEYITDMLIPLPPLSEQRRIVAKIEQLFAAIDKLK